jgi:hypothetical protein
VIEIRSLNQRGRERRGEGGGAEKQRDGGTEGVREREQRERQEESGEEKEREERQAKDISAPSVLYCLLQAL